MLLLMFVIMVVIRKRCSGGIEVLCAGCDSVSVQAECFAVCVRV